MSAEWIVLDLSEGEAVETTRAATAQEKTVAAAHLDAVEAADRNRPANVLDRLAAVEARLDKAASASVTGDAAKVRDGLKPVT